MVIIKYFLFYMSSSYNKKDIGYNEFFQFCLFLINPKKIVEFGILNGFSLDIFKEKKDVKIEAYDIFEDFNGNHCKRELIEKYSEYENVKIEYGDFYKKINDFEDNSIDILHIDIANNGDVYEFALENYFKKVSNNGIMILEGGSQERDNVGWMKKYNKPSIVNILKMFKENGINVLTLGDFPSLTIIKKSFS